MDDLDRQLVQCLTADGRASFSAIAEVLGVSDQTVARRYKRLRSAAMVRVVGLKYPGRNGYANWYLRLRCVPGSGETIAAALARRHDTTWIQLPRSGRIVAVTAYSPVFGFRAMAWLWLSVPPAHLADVGTDLAKFPEAAYVTATTGPANLAACVICRDEHSLYEFLTTKVGALPDVERVETAPVIRTIKQASPLMAPRP